MLNKFHIISCFRWNRRLRHLQYAVYETKILFTLLPDNVILLIMKQKLLTPFFARNRILSVQHKAIAMCNFRLSRRPKLFNIYPVCFVKTLCWETLRKLMEQKHFLLWFGLLRNFLSKILQKTIALVAEQQMLRRVNRIKCKATESNTIFLMKWCPSFMHCCRFDVWYSLLKMFCQHLFLTMINLGKFK